MGKDPATVSKWCTNSAQPGLETLFAIAEQLNVRVRDLLRRTRIARTILTIIIPTHWQRINMHVSVTRALDKCFSNFSRKFFIEDLQKAVCDYLYAQLSEKKTVSKRQIYSDIQEMKTSPNMSAPIEASLGWSTSVLSLFASRVSLLWI